jgi:solute:Na+ symporter, SSS family
VTIYGVLGQRYGTGAKSAAGVMFLFGRLLSSGARLFMAGIGFALMLYGEMNTNTLIFAVVLLGIIGTAYTIFGGIRAVIWTDVVQIMVMVIAALCAVFLLLRAIPVPFGQILAALKDADGVNKLQLVDTSFALDKAYTIWTGVFAMIVVGVSTHGVDQDMLQRVMTSRSPFQGGMALISSIIIGIPVICLFMVIGMLLFVFYQRPELDGCGTAAGCGYRFAAGVSPVCAASHAGGDTGLDHGGTDCRRHEHLRLGDYCHGQLSCGGCVCPLESMAKRYTD